MMEWFSLAANEPIFSYMGMPDVMATSNLRSLILAHFFSAMLGEGADFESLNVETHKRLHQCSEIIRKRDLRVGDKKLNAIEPTGGPEQVISMKLLQSKLKDNQFVQTCFKVHILNMLKRITLGMAGIL